jgi:hypothetical protein
VTPNEKLVWAAAFAQQGGNPISAAYKVVQLRSIRPDGTFPKGPTDEEVSAMLEEMRRDA